jgi:hypothetical protein
MTLSEAQIMQNIILPAIEQAKSQIPYFACENPTDQTPLYGVSGAVMDSLNLVTFIFILEDAVAKVVGRPFSIDTQDILNEGQNPFSNLRALAQFLKTRFDETGPER